MLQAAVFVEFSAMLSQFILSNVKDSFYEKCI